MTCLPSGNWRNICANAALAFALAGCASTASVTHPAELSVEKEESRQRAVSGQYEWAVQSYEAGNYEEAIQRFRSLASLGPDVPGYELVPFYLGMSLYHRKEYGPARAQLENFLQKRLDRRQNEDARIALLSLFERTEQWDRLLGLAAEMDKLTLLQNNRARLKLLWARALWEKGETKSAKVVLSEALPFLDGEAELARSLDREEDPWGRYHFTEVLLRERECSESDAKLVAGRRLYLPWLEATVDCYRKTIRESIPLVSRESLWAAPAFEQVDRSLGKWGDKIHGHLGREDFHGKRRLQEMARQQIYRLITSLEQTMKNFENQDLAAPYLQPLRKRLELLLLSLTQPS